MADRHGLWAEQAVLLRRVTRLMGAATKGCSAAWNLAGYQVSEVAEQVAHPCRLRPLAPCAAAWIANTPCCAVGISWRGWAQWHDSLQPLPFVFGEVPSTARGKQQQVSSWTYGSAPLY